MERRKLLLDGLNTNGYLNLKNEMEFPYIPDDNAKLPEYVMEFFKKNDIRFLNAFVYMQGAKDEMLNSPFVINILNKCNFSLEKLDYYENENSEYFMDESRSLLRKIEKTYGVQATVIGRYTRGTSDYRDPIALGSDGRLYTVTDKVKCFDDLSELLIEIIDLSRYTGFKIYDTYAVQSRFLNEWWEYSYTLEELKAEDSVGNYYAMY